MAAPHLLGAQFEWYRWYNSEAERDQAMREMTQQFRYYRQGDFPSQVLEKVERAVSDAADAAA